MSIRSKFDFATAKKNYETEFPLNKLEKASNLYDPCTINCHIHGEVEASSYMHLVKSLYGCPLCGKHNKGTYNNISVIANKFKVASERYSAKYPDKKLLSYTGSDGKYTIDCEIHGKVTTTFAKIINSDFGCPQCVKESEIEERKAKVLETHKARYEERFPENKLVHYESSTKPCSIICHVHGLVENLNYANIVRSTTGCPLCGQTTRKHRKSTVAKRIQEVKDKYRKKFPNNQLIDYTSATSTCTIICSIHGEQKGIYANLMRSKFGCPECADLAVKTKRSAYKNAIQAVKAGRYNQDFDHHILNELNRRLKESSAEYVVKQLSTNEPRIENSLDDNQVNERNPEPKVENPPTIDPSVEYLVQHLQTTEPIIYDSVEELPNEDFVLVPFYNDIRLSAGSGQFPTDLETRPIPLSRLDLQKKGINPKNVICCKVRGDSMEPMLQDGAMVGIDMSDTEVKAGKIYAFVESDGTLRIKSLIQMENGSFKIHSINFAYPTEIVKAKDIKVIGRLFWASTIF